MNARMTNDIYIRWFLSLILASICLGCRSYVQSTPSKTWEGDHAKNYERIFREPIPADVAVVNSVVVTYSYRPGVVTTADFEFELIVPPSWVEKATKRYYLHKNNSEFIRDELGARRQRARTWYAPKPLDQYDLYRDATSVGYVHMLVQKEPEADGKRRVFISKH